MTPTPRRLLRLSALLVLGGAAMRCDRSAPPGAPGALTGGATALESSGRWAEAAAARRADALRLGPGRWDADVRQALADYLMANDSGAATKLAAECLGKDPKYLDVLYYLGESYRVMQRHEEAEQTLRRLVEAEPGHVRGALSLAHVLSRLGRSDDALPLFDRALASPSLPKELRAAGRIDRARALRRAGRAREAASDLASMLEADPFDPVAVAEAAQVFASLGRQDVAKGLRDMHAWLFERGHQLSTEDETKEFSTAAANEGAKARLALQAADKRRFLEATSALEAIVARDPADWTSALALARLWTRLSRLEDVARIVENARRAGTATADLLALGAEAAAGLARREAALALYEEASGSLLAGRAGGLADDPAGAADLHLRAGLAALDAGDAAKAAGLLARAEAAAPGDWRAPYGQGRALLAGGDAKGAALQLAKAREAARGLEREPAELRRWAAGAAGLAGDLQLAARDLLRLVKSSPGDVETLDLFARVFAGHESDPEVARVLEMRRAAVERRSAREEAVRRLSAKPLEQSAPEALALGKLHLAEGGRDRALDFLFLASDLDAKGVEALRAAADQLTAPRERFVRLRTLRLILERAPSDPPATAAVLRMRAELDVGEGPRAPGGS